MGCRRRAPKATEKPSDYQILFGFRQRAQRCPWLRAFQQHCAQLVVGVQEPYRWISIPEAQPLDFVFRFEVRHAELQYGGGSVRTRHRRHPRASRLLVGPAENQRPSVLDVSYGVGQSAEPCRALGSLAAVGCELLWDTQCHASFWPSREYLRYYEFVGPSGFTGGIYEPRKRSKARPKDIYGKAGAKHSGSLPQQCAEG